MDKERPFSPPPPWGNRKPERFHEQKPMPKPDPFFAPPEKLKAEDLWDDLADDNALEVYGYDPD